MRKVLFGGLVLAGLLLAYGAAPDPVVGQKKKAASSAVGVIEIGEGKDGKFRFFVRDDGGKLLAMSGPGGFATVKDAQTAIEHLKDVISTAKVTTIKKKTKKSKDDQ
jgi:hypothetical protein